MARRNCRRHARRDGSRGPCRTGVAETASPFVRAATAVLARRSEGVRLRASSDGRRCFATGSAGKDADDAASEARTVSTRLRNMTFCQDEREPLARDYDRPLRASEVERRLPLVG